MVELQKAQFRMVTHLGDRPGTQGTLFQGGTGQPWPRGYSPARRDEVRGALHDRTGPEEWKDPVKRNLIENIARSTVPKKFLSGFTLQPGTVFPPKLLGDYTPGNPGRIRLAAGQETTNTPIHEIGHNASIILKNVSSKFDTPARKGADEGFAENFAETHWRQDPRETRKVGEAPKFTTNPARWSSDMVTKNRDAFDMSFRRVRAAGSPGELAEAAATEESRQNVRAKARAKDAHGEQLQLWD